MSNYEHCCECNERTGRAGASDDSLYLGSVGPFCEDCVDTWPDKVAEENVKLISRNIELECMVKVFRGCIDTQTLPGQGSRCHKKVYDLVGDPDDGGGCDA